jgi:hypothetical protein
MEGTACGDEVTVSKIEEKHIFFMTLRTICCSLFYAISDGPIILVKNSLSDVKRIFGKCYGS